MAKITAKDILDDLDTIMVPSQKHGIVTLDKNGTIWIGEHSHSATQKELEELFFALEIEASRED